MSRRDPFAAPDFPAPRGSAGAAHFAGEDSLRRAERTAELRARAGWGGARGGGWSDAPAAGSSAEWPRPPACITAAELRLPPNGARVAVCGLVIVRQRPGSAKGVTFVTLEDETGVVNLVIWSKLYEASRRAVLAARLMRATGRVQREGDVTHVVADSVEDVSHMLDTLAAAPRFGDAALAPADEGRRPQPEDARGRGGGAATRTQGLIRGAVPRATHPREQAKRLFRGAPEE